MYNIILIEYFIFCENIRVLIMLSLLRYNSNLMYDLREYNKVGIVLG